ncbi:MULTISPECIES: hypothetical protein [Legionella]|uniref:Uncharacterized protein n=1 Tax=Legionella steelei TaxID=947033 RepID=A0A0W0ZEK8_9GAMM|nr:MULTISPECIES: hypothetical protein [Legionella]KTD67222.1 hypothetical protein Lste_3428 [Legionella steelei]MBN9228239.1 hypothetical protein [Legionella steelei]OJW09486.1 MAG: hypothetical protein BGO44_04200 [Legionella sp. 39-23]
MPSSQLSSLCDLIEKQNTDHFAKFYMYASLLNTLTAKNKTFAGGLPQYTGFWGGTTELNLGGPLPVQFTKQLAFYAREFENTQPHWSKTLHNVVMTYLRKGKISDLAHIIDMMLFHLAAIHGRQSHNNDIYKDISFDKNKEGLTQFIEKISALNHQLLSTADSGCNTALSLLAVTAGFVLVLASIASVWPLVVGLPLLLGGAYATYHYATKAKDQFEQLIAQGDQIEKMVKGLADDGKLSVGDKNQLTFFAAAVKPLPYALVTAGDQLVMDQSQKQKVTEYREKLDRAFSILPS